jgi:hypothetical protein
MKLQILIDVETEQEAQALIDSLKIKPSFVSLQAMPKTLTQNAAASPQ